MSILKPKPLPSTDPGQPLSAAIRERMVSARKRFHANDNISDFIQAGELEQLLDEVEGKMQGVLDCLVIDTGECQGGHDEGDSHLHALARC